MADDVDNLIRERFKRFQNVNAEMLSRGYLREITDELTRLRFVIAGMRRVLEKMTGQ
jgi:hypothetical protein